MIASSMMSIFALSKIMFSTFTLYISSKYWIMWTSFLWSPCTFWVMAWFFPFCKLILFVNWLAEYTSAYFVEMRATNCSPKFFIFISSEHIVWSKPLFLSKSLANLCSSNNGSITECLLIFNSKIKQTFYLRSKISICICIYWCLHYFSISK